MIKEAINTLVNGKDLTDEVMTQVMEEIMTGEATDAQKASFLTALSIKGETIDEITAAAKVMSSKCTPFNNEDDALEIVGTGGDKANSFNISTLSAIVAAAAGVHVAKHGNRAASSKCGTADCLEALGVKIDIEPEHSEKLLKEDGICFLFAQKYHTAMRFVGAPRKEIKIPTVFNILGPLANPAKANLQLLGVYDASLVDPLAKVLSNLGVKRGMVVHGNDGLDEISAVTTTTVCEFNDGTFNTYTLDPTAYGFTLCDKAELVGGTPEENAQITKDILSGKITDGKRTAVILNAGAALHITNQISLEEGFALAADILANGSGLKKLEDFIAATNA